MGSGQKAWAMEEEERASFVESEYEKTRIEIPIKTLKALLVIAGRASYSLDEFENAKDAQNLLVTADALFRKEDEKAWKHAREVGEAEYYKLNR